MVGKTLRTGDPVRARLTVWETGVTGVRGGGGLDVLGGGWVAEEAEGGGGGEVEVRGEIAEGAGGGVGALEAVGRTRVACGGRIGLVEKLPLSGWAEKAVS